MTAVMASAVIRRGFRYAGLLALGQTLQGDYLADGLKELQLLVSQLNLVPPYSYTKLETVVPLAGQASRTLGPGAQIDIARPFKIERETFARVGQQDYPVLPVTREEFNRIVLKDTTATWPAVCFFDGGNPTGNLFVWPKGTCDLHLVTLQSVAAYATATTTQDLPDGYEDLLGLLLSERIAALYEVALRDSVGRLVKRAQRIVERSNHTVPQLDIGVLRIDAEAAFPAG